MDTDRTVTFRLPADTLAALTEAARQRRCSPAELIRAALAGVLTGRRPPDPPSPDDLRRIAAAAVSWHDLLRQLRGRGAVLRLAPDGGGDLWLHAWPSDRPLGPTSLWGIDRRGLTLRFGAPFPGVHSGTGLPVAATGT